MSNVLYTEISVDEMFPIVDILTEISTDVRGLPAGSGATSGPYRKSLVLPLDPYRKYGVTWRDGTTRSASGTASNIFGSLWSLS